MAFFAISDQCTTFYFFRKMAAGGHFAWPKITFDRISRYFRSIHNFNFFDLFLQNSCRRPFWMTENHFRSYFSPFQINTQLLFLIFSMDDRKSLLIALLLMALLAISDQYATFFFNFFFKMAAGGHFGSPIWDILDDRKSLSIAFLAISDQYTIFFLNSDLCQKQ